MPRVTTRGRCVCRTAWEPSSRAGCGRRTGWTRLLRGVRGRMFAFRKRQRVEIAWTLSCGCLHTCPAHRWHLCGNCAHRSTPAPPMPSTGQYCSTPSNSPPTRHSASLNALRRHELSIHRLLPGTELPWGRSKMGVRTVACTLQETTVTAAWMRRRHAFRRTGVCRRCSTVGCSLIFSRRDCCPSATRNLWTLPHVAIVSYLCGRRKLIRLTWTSSLLTCAQTSSRHISGRAYCLGLSPPLIGSMATRSVQCRLTKPTVRWQLPPWLRGLRCFRSARLPLHRPRRRRGSRRQQDRWTAPARLHRRHHPSTRITRRHPPLRRRHVVCLEALVCFESVACVGSY
eukprot:Opistho-2@8149